MYPRNPFLVDELSRVELKLPSFFSPKPSIKKVIFNDSATIVIWSDNTKTVVKCQEGDDYDEEKGLALCISKKFFGNKGNFNEVFKKWIPDHNISVNNMRDKLENYCDSRHCNGCPLDSDCYSCEFESDTESHIKTMYKKVFNNKED